MDDVPQAEDDVARRDRVARERAVMDKGEADIDAGYGIEDEDIEAVLDALDREEAERVEHGGRGERT